MERDQRDAQGKLGGIRVNDNNESNNHQITDSMISKEELKYLYISTCRTLKESMVVSDKLAELGEYASEKLGENEELMKLIDELDKAMRQRDNAEGVVRNIIHYHFEEE